MPLFSYPRFREHSKGTIAADGSEQIVGEIVRQVQEVSAYIDVTNMAAGDTTVLRTYIKIKSGGAYINFASRILTGNQAPDLMYMLAVPATQFGIKITLEQTGGTYRNYDYVMFTFE